ncbi:WXG100 family type VII secretion target [Fodinicola feengrottensis]|uniref:WXG100 family type VII secretion target n=1 Tax=Fodinicola feengrottensis TaxID=435914 RepID=A0ABP4VFM8_9ACTN|nr:WXG100 family type VII secretion target [Fodinicola feengrottensis]
MDRLDGVTESIMHGGRMAHTVAQNLDGHSKTLAGHIASLNGQISGSYATALYSAHDQWQAGHLRLSNALRAMGDSTNYSGNLYDQADQNLHQSFSSVLGSDPFGGALGGPTSA